jgi:prophage antirepressor-like protein
MRIFVAYGYNERDRWVEELVFPVIRAFGDEVVTGEELQGEQITDAVIAKIRSSDALIGFLTRRDQIGSSDRWTTHRWVTDEISQAVAQRIFVAEVRAGRHRR